MKKWIAPTLLASMLALAACGTDEVDKDDAPAVDDDNNVETPQVDTETDTQVDDMDKDADITTDENKMSMTTKQMMRPTINNDTTLKGGSLLIVSYHLLF